MWLKKFFRKNGVPMWGSDLECSGPKYNPSFSSSLPTAPRNTTVFLSQRRVKETFSSSQCFLLKSLVNVAANHHTHNILDAFFVHAFLCSQTTTSWILFSESQLPSFWAIFRAVWTYYQSVQGMGKLRNYLIAFISQKKVFKPYTYTAPLLLMLYFSSLVVDISNMECENRQFR